MSRARLSAGLRPSISQTTFLPPVEDGVTFRVPLAAKRPVQKRGIGGKRGK